MRPYPLKQLLLLLRTGLSYALIALFSTIISVQNMSVTHSVHAQSKTTCSCGCQDDGGSCEGNCCSTQSVSQCNCSEPHQTVVTFIIPSTLDLFLQITEKSFDAQDPLTEFFQRGIAYYDSFIWEPPVPIPIA